MTRLSTSELLFVVNLFPVALKLPTSKVMFSFEMKIIFAVKILPSFFLQLNFTIKLTRFKKEQEVEELSELEMFEIWRVKFGKVKFSGKMIGSSFKLKMFKRMVLPRSISRLESSNLIKSSNFFSHFNKLQFDVGVGVSDLKMWKIIHLQL